MQPICQDCGRPSKWPLARGRCRTCYPKHIEKLKAEGTYRRLNKRPAVDRVLERVTPGWGGCVLWTGPTTNGYGRVMDRGKNTGAYRAVYEAMIGEIPAGMDLDHVCHTESADCEGGDDCIHRRCVNPWHMEPVTPSENARRSLSPMAKNGRKTHCPSGHEYSEDNTYWAPSGQRCCKECRREHRRAAYVKRPRVRKERTHCRNGHLRTDENLFTDSKGARTCRECQREADRRHKARKKQA